MSRSQREPWVLASPSASEAALEEPLSEDRSEEFAALGLLLAPLPASAEARARLLSAAEEAGPATLPWPGSLADFFDLTATESNQLEQRAQGPGAWEATPIAGLRLLHLQAGPRWAGADAGLVWAAAGLEFPQHRHLGDEHVLVLQGALEQSDGRVLRPGDTQLMRKDSVHAWRALAAEPLIYALVLCGTIEIVGSR